MNKIELMELIHNEENSRVEFERDDLRPVDLAKEMAALLNHARNQLLVNVMRDYEYVDARGMGVRNKLIPGMKAHNGTEPDLIEEEYRFTVRLWKEANAHAS